MEVRDVISADGMTTAIVAPAAWSRTGRKSRLARNFVLSATTEAIARELGDALVAPIVKFLLPTQSAEQEHTQLTFSVRQETFSWPQTDVVMSLEAHGFTDIVLTGAEQSGRVALSRGIFAGARAFAAQGSS